MKKADFNQHLECAAPTCWSKHTTERIPPFIRKIKVKKLFGANIACQWMVKFAITFIVQT